VGSTERSALRRAALTMWVIFGLVLGADSAVAAPAPVPCSAVGGGKYECDWWRPGDGRDGGAIVVSNGKVVGYLHQGRNWITCQEQGADVYNEDGNKNRWYGWTQSDYGGWGWASALDAKGGDDNGKFEAAPSCKGKHGPAPGTGGLWSTRAPGGSPPEGDAPHNDDDQPAEPTDDRKSCGSRTALRVRETEVAKLFGERKVTVGSVQNCVVSKRGAVFGRTYLRLADRWDVHGQPSERPLRIRTSLVEGGSDRDGRPGGDRFRRSHGYLTVRSKSYALTRAFGRSVTGEPNHGRDATGFGDRPNDGIYVFETRRMKPRSGNSYDAESRVIDSAVLAFIKQPWQQMKFAGWAPTAKTRPPYSDNPLVGLTLSWSGGQLMG
jgi:hypothetical protein